MTKLINLVCINQILSLKILWNFEINGSQAKGPDLQSNKKKKKMKIPSIAAAANVPTHGDFYKPRKARFIPTFCKRINRTSTAVEIWVTAFEERKTNDLNLQQNLCTTTTTTINRGFTPNEIINECVSNSSKKSPKCKIK